MSKMMSEMMRQEEDLQRWRIEQETAYKLECFDKQHLDPNSLSMEHKQNLRDVAEQGARCMEWGNGSERELALRHQAAQLEHLDPNSLTEELEDENLSAVDEARMKANVQRDLGRAVDYLAKNSSFPEYWEEKQKELELNPYPEPLLLKGQDAVDAMRVLEGVQQTANYDRAMEIFSKKS